MLVTTSTDQESIQTESEILTLLRLATAQAECKDYESAMESLRKAYKFMESAGAEWPINTYFRLARYLHLSGSYEKAIDWLQQLHDNLDARCDAREILYKQWGWMQSSGKSAKIPKLLRNNYKRMIKREIVKYAERQSKITRKISAPKARLQSTAPN